MDVQPFCGLLQRLSRDIAGNTLAMVAAAIFPILAMVGGGIDMGRAYLSQSRLQQACDAGVLAARKRLSSESAASGTIPAEVVNMGARFFNINFRNGSYGTQNRSFQMTLEDDFSISGKASVEVDTTLMQIFGFDKVDVSVDCLAQRNMNNTDIMFVLDTTGSMLYSNPGDDHSRVDTMRAIIKDFAAQLNNDADDAARVRFGFVPYASNVNVGGLLKSDWMVDAWMYQSRVATDSGDDWIEEIGDHYIRAYNYASGTRSTLPAFVAATCPAPTIKDVWGDPVDEAGNPVDPATKPPVYYRTRLRNGKNGYCKAIEGGYEVHAVEYIDYLDNVKFTLTTGTTIVHDIIEYSYMPILFDVSAIKGATGDDVSNVGAKIQSNTMSPAVETNFYYSGCIEERSTYEIKDYSRVDFDRALDLNLDLVPNITNYKTLWRPKFPGIEFIRKMKWDGTGSFKKGPVMKTSDDYINPTWIDDLSACPAPASKLKVMTSDEISNYLDKIQPAGKTNHDIGMIWGGRLLSPTGLFADENSDVAGMPTRRHMIFLTDGQTDPSDLVSGAYGIEPLDGRRWDHHSSLTMTEMIEKRFSVACDEVKKKNITVWVIAFGTEINPIMTKCAGPGHYFEAADGAQLNLAFAASAEKMKQLRITG